jgi:hypothetical protein
MQSPSCRNVLAPPGTKRISPTADEEQVGPNQVYPVPQDLSGPGQSSRSLLTQMATLTLRAPSPASQNTLNDEEYLPEVAVSAADHWITRNLGRKSRMSTSQRFWVDLVRE